MNALDLIQDAGWKVLLIHLLAYPIYQILGTLRHEGAHAIAAMLYGFRIIEFKVFPHVADGKWYFGHVYYDTGGEEPSSNIHLAPYYVDVICGVALAAVLRLVEFSNVHWALFALIMLGVSPVLDTGYNVMKWFLWRRGDFAMAFGKEGVS